MNAIPQDQKLEEILGRAKHAASQGSVYGAENYLNDARRFAAEAGLEIPEATVQSIGQNAYRLGINVALERAKHDASQGSVYGAENYLNEARRFAAKAGIEIPEATLQSIGQNAYRCGIDVALERAKHDASQGSVYGAENHLDEARRFAAKAGIEIPEATVQSIEQNAYRFGVDTALSHARCDASEGRVHGAHSYLSEARRFAAKIVGGGLDISQRVEEIEAMLRK